MSPKKGANQRIGITDAEIRFYYNVHQGCHNKIAKALACTRENIRQRCQKLGLNPTRGKKHKMSGGEQ